MKRIIAGLTAALALALVGSARADDTQTTKDKTAVKKSTEGTEPQKTEKKAEKKATTDPSATTPKPMDTDATGKAVKQEKSASEAK